MANGVFTTAPFNLGNTLAQAAQIQNFRSTNRLRQAQLEEQERLSGQRGDINTLLQNPDFDITSTEGINQLARTGGQLGVQRAGQFADFQTKLANLDIAERQAVLANTEFINLKARAIAESPNPKQRLFAEMQDESFADIVNGIIPNFDPSVVSDEAFAQGLQQIITETDSLRNQIQLVSGPEVIAEGFDPGTVLKQTITPTGEVDVSVIQKGQPSETALDAETRLTKKREANLKTEAGLRGEFNSLLTDFNKVANAHARIRVSAANPSPAGDLALVFNYMKMLDPGSVVRESEFANAAQTGSLESALKNKFGKVFVGEILQFTREDFVEKADELFISAQAEAQKTADAYEGIATRAGVDAEDVLANFLQRNTPPEPIQTTESVFTTEPPVEALQLLFSNPQLADDFEAKYGALPPNFTR